MISLIWAQTKNGIIGNNNQIPWSLPNDMKWFKDNTTGQKVVMGHKTFKSIGRPLPNRENIILSRDENLTIDGCLVVNSIDEILEIALDDDVFIIGGSEIYERFIKYADRIVLTTIETEIDGDTYAPIIDNDEWDIDLQLVNKRDDKNEFDHSFFFLSRKN